MLKASATTSAKHVPPHSGARGPPEEVEPEVVVVSPSVSPSLDDEAMSVPPVSDSEPEPESDSPAPSVACPAVPVTEPSLSHATSANDRVTRRGAK